MLIFFASFKNTFWFVITMNLVELFFSSLILSASTESQYTDAA